MLQSVKLQETIRYDSVIGQCDTIKTTGTFAHKDSRIRKG